MRAMARSKSVADFTHRQRTSSAPTAAQIAAYSDHEKMFIQAQQYIGIPAKDLLPIKTILRNEQEDQTGYAFTSTDNICIIKENFELLPFGAKKIIALHEAFHHKFNDQTIEKCLRYKAGVAMLVTFTTKTGVLMYLSWPLIGGVAACVASPLLALVGTSLLFRRCVTPDAIQADKLKLMRYREFRADQEAVKASQCCKCVEEYQSLRSPGVHNVYMNPHELQKYVDAFKKKLCSHHAHTTK
jgi:hypothetical protein